MPQVDNTCTDRCLAALDSIVGTTAHIQITEDSIALLIEETHAYRCSLVFAQAAFTGDFVNYIYITRYALTQSQNRQTLTLYAVCDAAPNERCWHIDFDEMHIDDEVFSAMTVTELRNPWYLLADIAYELLTKHDHEVELSSAENDLLPICRALLMLTAYTNRKISLDLDTLAPLFTDCSWPNHDRIQRRLRQIAKARSDEAAYRWLTCLIVELCDHRYEPVWRQLYARFAASQAALPNRMQESDLFRDRIRGQITNNLHQQGFIGEYPEFQRSISPRKTLYIRCAEEFGDESGLYYTRFLCGYSIGAKSDSDALSCLFNDRHRRQFQCFSMWINLDQPDLDDYLHQFTTIAEKKAANKPLTRKENANLHFVSQYLNRLALFVLCLRIGLVAGLFMTLGLATIPILLPLIFEGSLTGVLDTLCAIPWILIFAASTLFWTVFMYLFCRFTRSPI